MRIMMAGGTGLIGSSLTALFVRSGHAVLVLTRNPERRRVSTPGVEYLGWDGEHGGPWQEAVSRVDAIVNLAGTSIGGGRWTEAFKKNLIRSRLNATRTLIDAVAKSTARPRTLVNASAVGYYGHVPSGDLMESSPPGNDFLADQCIQWEQEACRGEEYGMRVLRMRTGFVIGRSAPAFRKLLVPYRFYAGTIYGTGEQWLPWVHIDDVASAYLYALENQKTSGAVNVVAPDGVTSAQFVRAIGVRLGQPVWLRAPAWALRLMLGEMSDLLLKGQNAVPHLLLENGFHFRFPTVESALEDLLDNKR